MPFVHIYDCILGQKKELGMLSCVNFYHATEVNKDTSYKTLVDSTQLGLLNINLPVGALHHRV